MIFIKPSHEILTDISKGGINELKLIERCARVSYRSEDRITEDGESAKKMITMLIKNGHESCLEHSILTVVFICDRAIANELVRHRLASFTQESTRYVNVKAEKLGANGEMQVILPLRLMTGATLYKRLEAGEHLHEIKDLGIANNYYELSSYKSFVKSMEEAENKYKNMILYGAEAETARGVLPLSLATKIVMTANYREWRHIFNLRCDSHAHPEMRRIMIPLLHEVQNKIPVVFDNINF